jgi:hypothetical protein
LKVQNLVFGDEEREDVTEKELKDQENGRGLLEEVE